MAEEARPARSKWPAKAGRALPRKDRHTCRRRVLPSCERGKFIHALQRCDRAAGVGRATAALDLEPIGLATQGHQRAVVESLDPAAPIVCLVAAKVEPGNLRATQTAGKAEQLHPGPVAKPAQRTAGERLQHGDQIFWEDRFLLPRQCACRAGNNSRRSPRGAARWLRRHWLCRHARPCAEARATM